MAVALIATLVLLDTTPKPAQPTSLLAPLKALRHRGLLTMSVTALYQKTHGLTIPRSTLYLAVPKRFHPKPKGSDASGIMNCPAVNKSEKKCAR